MVLNRLSSARLPAWSLLILSLFCIEACKSEPAPVVVSAACQAYERARVSRGERCRNDELFRTSAPFTSEFALRCTALTQAPGSAWTEEVLQACAQGLSVGCDEEVEGCDALARGNLPGGAPCGASVQCASGYCVHPEAGVECGTCAPALALGDQCESMSPASGCPLGSSCGEWSADSGPPTCQARGEGESCLNGGCASGLFCSDSDTCAARRQKGESCDPLQVANRCANALTCVGGICGVRQDKGKACSDDTECDVRLRCVGGLCAARPQASLGELCDDNIECGLGALCFSSRCMQRRALGESCGESRECVPFAICISGKCRTADASLCK